MSHPISHTNTFIQEAGPYWRSLYLLQKIQMNKILWNIVSILPPGGLSQYDCKWRCWLYQIQWHPRGGWHHVVLSHRGALCNHNYLVVSSWIVVVVIFPLFITNTNHIMEPLNMGIDNLENSICVAIFQVSVLLIYFTSKKLSKTYNCSVMHAFKWKGNEGVGWPATTLQLGNRHAMRWPHIVRNIKSGQMQNIFMYFCSMFSILTSQ